MIKSEILTKGQKKYRSRVMPRMKKININSKFFPSNKQYYLVVRYRVDVLIPYLKYAKRIK